MSVLYSTQEFKKLLKRAREGDTLQILLHSQTTVKIRWKDVEHMLREGFPGGDLGRSPGGAHGSPLRYSAMENPMDREAWWTMVSP